MPGARASPGEFDTLCGMPVRSLLCCAALLAQSMAQPHRAPNVEAQREAMKKLDFLIGTWSGEARIQSGPGEPVELIQTEEARYKLDGLLLVVEGMRRARSGGKVILQALGIVSYDDEAGTYRMRAFNDGRWLETDVKLAATGKGLAWGFALGEIKTRSTLSMNEKGEWTELHEITVGSEAPRKFMEVAVRPQK